MDYQGDKPLNLMILIYKGDKNEINIFGGDFVSRCIENCYLLIDGEKKDLQSKYECTKDQIEIRLIETETIDDMSSMFDGCATLISVKAEGWNFSNVNNMSYMFNNCSSLQSLEGLSNADISKVESLSYMFNGCSSLKSLKGLENWNT